MSTVAPLEGVPDAEAIRQATREILRRPEFSGPSPWEETLRSLLKMIHDSLSGLAEWSVQNPTLARIAAIVVALLMAASLIHILYLALADLWPFQKALRQTPDRSSRWDILEGVAANWREGLNVARRLLEEGDCRRAVWIAHRVFLGLLDERGAIRFAGWKTNAHYLSEVAPSHPWYSTFAEFTDLYDQAIYAHKPASQSSVHSLIARIGTLLEEPTG